MGGAFGQNQFMPSTFLRLAQDFDGDGRKDLVSSQADALASTAISWIKQVIARARVWGLRSSCLQGFGQIATAKPKTDELLAQSKV